MNDFTNRNKFSHANNRVFIWYRTVRFSEGVIKHKSAIENGWAFNTTSSSKY